MGLAGCWAGVWLSDVIVVLNQTNEWRRDFGEEVKGHGALAARTAG